MINSFRGEYSFLSNFSPASVHLDEVEYPTVEHAYQAAKTLDIKERNSIRLAPSPGTAKKLGRHVTLRQGWGRICVQVMEDLLRQKFTYHKELRNKLIATGDISLEEGSYWGDRFWGTVDGVGENHLGKLLMKIREEVKSGVHSTSSSARVSKVQ
jgi:ribA/ribD-fused uncharacterized protein